MNDENSSKQFFNEKVRLIKQQNQDAKKIELKELKTIN